SLAAAEAELAPRQSGAIRFNYIVYRKVTSDEKVVSSDEAGIDPGESVKSAKPEDRISTASERVLGQLESYFSLARLADDPEAAGRHLSESAGASGDNRARLAEHLRRLVHEVETGGDDIEGLSPEQLFTAVSSLRQR